MVRIVDPRAPRPISSLNPPTALQARQLTQSPQGMVPRGNLTPRDVQGILASPVGRVPGGGLGGPYMPPDPRQPVLRPMKISNPGGPTWNPYSKGGIVKKGKAQRRDYCK